MKRDFIFGWIFVLVILLKNVLLVVDYDDHLMVVKGYFQPVSHVRSCQISTAKMDSVMDVLTSTEAAAKRRQSGDGDVSLLVDFRVRRYLCPRM